MESSNAKMDAVTRHANAILKQLFSMQVRWGDPTRLFFFQKNDKKDSIAAGNTRGRVQLAGHKGWEPEDGFDDVTVEVPGVPFVCAVAPAVLALVGAEELTARLATKTFKALNSCPRPVVPS